MALVSAEVQQSKEVTSLDTVNWYFETYSRELLTQVILPASSFNFLQRSLKNCKIFIALALIERLPSVNTRKPGKY